MRNVAIKLLVVSMLASTPFLVSAQQADDQTRGAQQTSREDHSEWGWLGLLGLAGLVGLKRRDRDQVGTRDRASAR